MKGKILTAVILLAIVVLCFFIIRKRVKEIRAGKYCSCSHCDGNCGHCQNKENKLKTKRK